MRLKQRKAPSALQRAGANFLEPSIPLERIDTLKILEKPKSHNKRYRPTINSERYPILCRHWPDFRAVKRHRWQNPVVGGAQ